MGRFEIREASAADYDALGELTVRAYRSLAGMPPLEEAPGYYAELADVRGRAAAESNRILAAYDEAGRLLGGTTFIDEVYGKLWGLENSAGIRMLVVDPDVQAAGVGRALVEYSLDRARGLGRRTFLLHTTRPMERAQRMYAKFGFRREPDLDFDYEGMRVMGYLLELS